MKRLIFLISFIVSLTSYLISRDIVVNRVNGGPNGYYTVTERHEDGGWFTGAKSTLNCVDPGLTPCEWKVNPITLPELIGSGVEYKDLQDYAEYQITHDNIVGSYSEQQTYNGVLYDRSVTWTSNGTIENSQISITIVPVEN